MRNSIVSEFSSDVLGPLFGMKEELGFKPNERYITGILAPNFIGWQDGDVIEEDESIDNVGNIGERLTGQEDTEDKGVSIVPGEQVYHSDADQLSPIIDPRTFPKNMGISFNVEKQESPGFELVITYAKYEKNSDEKWLRKPRAIHISQAR